MDFLIFAFVVSVLVSSAAGVFFLPKGSIKIGLSSGVLTTLWGITILLGGWTSYGMTPPEALSFWGDEGVAIAKGCAIAILGIILGTAALHWLVHKAKRRGRQTIITGKQMRSTSR